MNLKFQKPDMLKEAQNYGANALWVECFQLLGIFFVINIVVSLFSGLALGIVIGITHHSEKAFTLEQLMEVNTILSLIFQILTIVFTLLLAKWIQKRKPWTLGFKKEHWLREYAVGMAAGLGMMSLLVFIAWLTGSMSVVFNPEVLTAKGIAMLALYFVGFLFQGMAEEVICRGYFLISLARKKENLWMAILVSSLVFAAAHLLNPGITFLAFCNLTLFGIFAGIYFLKRGNLWGIGALHSLWNFAQGNIWGVCVSGAITGPSLFRSDSNAQLSILNGGSFGLEGGLLTTVILSCGIVILLMLPQKDVVPDSAPQA